MNNMEFVEHFISHVQRSEGNAFTIDKEVVASELLKDKQAYSGLGIKILSICGGLLGFLFFLGFIILAIMASSIATLVFGLLITGAAIVIDRLSTNAVLDAICIGAFLSGCSLIGYSTNELISNDNITICALTVVGLVTIMVSENYMLNFFSILLINGCLLAFIQNNNLNVLCHVLTAFLSVGLTLVYLMESKALANSKDINVRYAPFRLGFLISLIVMLIFLSINFTHPQVPYRWISSIILIIVIFFNVRNIINTLQLDSNRIIVYVFTVLVLSSVIFAPSICGAILILILGFHFGHRLTAVLGILSLIYFVGHFYYDLQYTLLTKSVLMMCTGSLLLLAGFIFNKKLKKLHE